MSSNNQMVVATQSTRKRRRLHEEEVDTPQNEPPIVTKLEGTKDIDADVIVPLADPQREKKFFLYLSGFAPNTTVNEVANLVMKNLNTNETVDVAKLVPKDRDLCELTFVSFKVGIGLQLKELALQSSS